ncbi:MAG: hypothetical protein K6A23_09290 [Butyrivibrio sp.]|nr:hypothetical protein [Butyrivibrio sp.]
MPREDNDFKAALEGKNIPILTLDEKWHLLFAEMEKTPEIEELERELNVLVDQESALHDECKKIKVLKKKLLGEIVPLRDKASRTGDKKIEHQLQETKRLIEDCNRKLEDHEDELLDLPREMYKVNYELMLATMDLCYEQMHDNTKEINQIDKWIRKVRIELKKNIIKLQEEEMENFNIYSYMHKIFGPEVIEIFDMTYDPDRRHPIRTPDGDAGRNYID